MTNEERAREAAEQIGFVLDKDAEEAIHIILAALDAATAPLVAERERLRDVLKNIRDYGELANVSAGSGFGHGGKKSPSKDVWQFPRHLLVDLEAALAEKEPG